ncbi:dihydrodipicolinate synthase family protein [Salinisphaera sp. SPP-AMP-43]|uniref:dihydrodipicolinate synthase family protein n=1 Tax=Salinisphaera sp. SPP-AMP-43 TaxID=3121288 RepID=UPI003C6E60C5
MLEARCYVPLVTPLRSDGSVCKESVFSLVRWLDRPGLGFMPCMSTGEGAVLTDEQWTAMLRYVMDQVAPERVFAGILRSSTSEASRLIGIAQELGAKHAIVGSPFGKDVSQDDIKRHFQALIDVSSLDFWIYHEHETSGNDIGTDTLLNIARHERVTGIKDSYAEPRSDLFIRALKDCGVSYFVGWEALVGTSAEHDGSVVGLANIEPSACYLASLSADDDRINTHICALSEANTLFAEDWYCHIKVKLQSIGVIAETCLANQIPKQPA